MSGPRHATSTGLTDPTVTPGGDGQGSHDIDAGDGHGTDKPLLESYARFRTAPLDAIKELSAQFFGSSWRNYDNVVGQPVFYSGYSDSMKESVLASPVLQAKVLDLATRRLNKETSDGALSSPMAQQRLDELKSQLYEVAASWTDQMICKMESKTFIKGAYYLATQLITRIYHQGIHVNGVEVAQLRSVAEQAARDKHSIIFLPCHKSHIDYVALQLVAYRIGMTLPIVVAGDNLNFPVVGPFLQHAGAMWIRRSFADDALYATLVQAYMDTLLQLGYNVECFIEGGRSRNGKLLQPKFGILSFFLESLLSGRVKDAIVVPVSIQYDKVIEVNSYISELLGQPKEKESLSSFLSASSILSLKLGRVDCRFHEPWSLRGFLNAQITPGRPNGSLQDSYDNKLKRRLLSVLGYKVLADINTASVVMPTALVGTVLLTLRGRGVGRSELIRRVDWLVQKVSRRGGKVVDFGTLSTADVVDRALDVLGPKLVGFADLVEPTFSALDRFQLSFYRNMTIHLFISEALVCTALYTKIKQDRHRSMKYDELYENVYFLSQLFRGEFIFPTTPLHENLSKTLSRLENDGILAIERSGTSDRNIATVSLSDRERASGRQDFDFYCFLLWPFIESSWLGAISLLMLAPGSSSSQSDASSSTGSSPVASGSSSSNSPQWLPLRMVLTAAQTLGKTLFAQGDVSYFEAVSRESLQRSFARFEEDGIIQTLSKGGNGQVQVTAKGGPMVRLSPEWATGATRPVGGGGGGGGGDAVVRDDGVVTVESDNRRGVSGSGASSSDDDGHGDGTLDVTRLWALAARIGAARIEGKSRRDGEVEKRRVEALVRLVREQLVRGVAVGVGADGDGRGGASAVVVTRSIQGGKDVGEGTGQDNESGSERLKVKRKTGVLGSRL